MTLPPHAADNAAEPSPSGTTTDSGAAIHDTSPTEERDWLTTVEVARDYHLSVGTLRYWRHIGYGPASFTLGRRKVVYRRADMDAWIAEQERHTRRGGTTAA